MTATKEVELVPAGEIIPPGQDNSTPTTSVITVLSMIDKLIARPEIPVERLDKLFDLHVRIEADDARKAYAAAFSKMQPELPIIEKRGEILNKHGGVQSKYPKWEDAVEQITPVLAKYGFGLSFRPKVMDGKISVICVLSHEKGHTERTDPYEVPADTSGNKNAVHAIGSSTSYGKRYTAFAMLNIVARGDDDDGKKGGDSVDDRPQNQRDPRHDTRPIDSITRPIAASDAGVIDEVQEAALRLLIKDSGANITRFLVCANAECISDIKADRFDELAGQLRRKKELAKGGAQ